MKKVARLFPVLALGALLAGCSDNHIMQMKDGSVRAVQGKPRFDQATGWVIYIDESGRKQAVQQSEIKTMRSL